MGMDAYHYKLISPTFEEHDSNIRIMLNKRMMAWYESKGYDVKYIREEKHFDLHNWIKLNKKYNEQDDFSIINSYINSDMEIEWFILKINDIEHLINKDDTFTYIVEKVVYFKAIEIGYLRKPFRHSEIPDTYDEKTDTLTINVTNFSDDGLKALELIKNIDAEQEKDNYIFIIDRNNLLKLSNFTNSKKTFKRNFINNYNKDSLIYMSW